MLQGMDGSGIPPGRSDLNRDYGRRRTTDSYVPGRGLGGAALAIAAIYSVFVFPFKYPKATLAAAGLAGAFGGLYWLFGGSDDSDMSTAGPVVWVPLLAIAWFCYSRFVRPNEQPNAMAQTGTGQTASSGQFTWTRRDEGAVLLRSGAMCIATAFPTGRPFDLLAGSTDVHASAWSEDGWVASRAILSPGSYPVGTVRNAAGDAFAVEITFLPRREDGSWEGDWAAWNPPPEPTTSFFGELIVEDHVDVGDLLLGSEVSIALPAGRYTAVAWFVNNTCGTPTICGIALYLANTPAAVAREMFSGRSPSAAR